METFNLLVIIISIAITFIWACEKRHEIKTMSITFLDDIDEEATDEDILKRQKQLIKDREELDYVTNLFQDVTMAVLRRLHCFSLVTILIMCFIIWYFFEEKKEDIAQPVYFFIGAYSQILIGMNIFKNYRFYDPRVIFLAR